MITCSSCYSSMQKTEFKGTPFWVCYQCHCRASTLSNFEKLCGKDTKLKLLKLVSDEEMITMSRRKCPLSGNPMVIVPLQATSGKSIRLDFCPSTNILFFDSGELQALRSKTADPPKARWSPLNISPRKPTSVLLKLRKEKAIREKFEVNYIDDIRFSERIFSFMGFPVETTKPLFRHRPWLTWLLVYAISFVSLYAFYSIIFQSKDHILTDFAFIASDPYRLYGLTPLTSFLLHASFAHLFGNMYFLWIFGDNVEDYLGKIKYILLIVFSTYCGDLLYMHFNPEVSIPSIGASGGISGIIAFYAFQFPRARIGLMPGPLQWVSWIYIFAIPAILALFVWVGFQFLIGILIPHTNINILAHLGGAAGGFIFWLLWRIRLLP